MSSFLAELKRRNVFKVGVAYAIVAWLLIQIADILFPTFNAPDWVMQVFTLIVLLGFLPALIIAWAFELTPQGLKLTADVPPEQSITHETGRRLNYIITGLLVGAMLGVGSFWLYNRQNESPGGIGTEAYLKLEQYIDAGDWEAAFSLAEQMQAQAPDDPVLEELWPQFSWLVRIPSEPEGAMVYRRAYSASDTDWKLLGNTPLENTRIPFGLSQLRFDLEGYRPLVRAIGGSGGLTKVLNVGQSFMLDKEDDLPEGKVRVPGWSETIDGEVLTFGDYYLDQYEVTNRRYKEFIEAGGYQRPEYWQHPFEREGRTLSWNDAMAMFTDRTGRPGPSTWEAGDYPDGEGDYPVSGVSWYEAAAYASYAREELPTVYHWRHAVQPAWLTWTIPPSNLDSDRTMAVGRSGAMNWAGSYDMFGNTREWCFNATGDQRFILGAGWNEADYVATKFDTARNPLDRSPGNGFRLAVTRDDATVAARRPVQMSESVAIDFDAEVPVSDDTFAAYQSMYAYDQLPLNAEIEQTETSRNWTRLRIAIDGASRGERMALYLYLPKSGTPPFQTVVYWEGARVIFIDSIDKTIMALDFLVKNGRAVAIPVFKNTLYRGGQGREALPERDSKAFRDLNIHWVTEYRRTLDYLETRSDIDVQHLAYYGISWGGVNAPAVLALEPRLKTAVLVVAGAVRIDPLMLQGGKSFPEIYPPTYLPRVKVPVLMLNGEYDPFFPLDIAARPFFEMLGTPAADKKHVVEPGGHFVPRPVLIRESLDWLDKYLGPVH